ncbi:hypothetical protein CS8_007840 [Cupriavidus sp. 8B]
MPRRYFVEACKRLAGNWDTRADAGRYDLWVLGPNGWHRHFIGSADGARTGLAPEIEIGYDIPARSLRNGLRNDADQPCTFVLAANAYVDGAACKVTVPARTRHALAWPVDLSGGWYDFTVMVAALPGYARRCAGRMTCPALPYLRGDYIFGMRRVLLIISEPESTNSSASGCRSAGPIDHTPP